MNATVRNRLKKLMLTLGGFSMMVISVVAQNGRINGSITDDNGIPLEYANVFAKDTTKTEKPAFALSNQSGKYELTLKKKVVYQVSVSYLGYEKVVEYLSLNEEDETVNFTLKMANNLLNEIVIKETIPPIIHKKDTIIYDAESFATGEERKLKELLNKLPGVEVDRNNTIYVHGEKVDRVFVENEPFFGGNSELAVKSIPSNAVSKVEVLKEHNDVDFLRAISSDNEIVVNVKLKEGKKKFVFGDVEAGIGIEEKYLANTNLFYYSPKMNVYGIGGSNNANVDLLTMEQFIQLQGGFGNIMGKDGNILNNASINLLGVQSSQNYTDNTAQLAAFGFDYKLSKKLKFSSFGVYAKQKIGMQSAMFNTYFLGNNLTSTENRTSHQNMTQQISFLKSNLIYDKREGEYLSIDFSLNAFPKKGMEELISIVPTTTDSFIIQQNEKPLNCSSTVKWHKKFSEKHISSLETNLQSNTIDNRTTWNSNNPFLEFGIPWIITSDSAYIIQQNNEEEIIRFDGNVKHYFILNDKNHFSLKSGWGINKIDANRQDYQILTTHQLLIEENNHGVSQILWNEDLYTGLTFRNKSTYLESEIGLTGHHLKWHFKDSNLAPMKLNFLLPHAKFEFTVRRIGKFDLSYAMNMSMPNHTDFFAGKYISSFNELRRGNPELQSEINHNFGLHLSKYNILNSSSFYFRANLSIQDKNIQRTMLFNEIERVSIPYLEYKNGIMAQIRSKYERHTNLGTITPTVRWSYLKYNQVLNSENTIFQQQTAVVGLKLERNINKYSFIEAIYRKRWTFYKENNKANPTINFDEWNVVLTSRLFNDFVVKSSYILTKFSGNQQSTIQSLNASIEYKKENNPWAFKLTFFNAIGVENILNNTYQRFYQSESNVGTFPRYVIGSVIYNL